MIGAVPFTFGGERIFSYSKHGTELSKLAAFAQAIQQEFTIANVPFCEIRDRTNLTGGASLGDGYGLHNKVIITFKVGGERFGFPIYAPRSGILTPVTVRKRTKYQVTDAMLDRFEAIYPAAGVEVETGWLCH